MIARPGEMAGAAREYCHKEENVQRLRRRKHIK